VADELDPVRVLRALARPGVGAELHALGVRDLSTFGGADVYIPSEHESWVRQLVDEVLGDDRPTVRDDLVGGRPYRKADYVAAAKLHVAGKMTVTGVEQRAGLSTKRAYRIYRQLRHGAVVYDAVGLRPGPGYRWDPDELDSDPPGYKLIRR
jgi:hypothetical protein